MNNSDTELQPYQLLEQLREVEAEADKATAAFLESMGWERLDGDYWRSPSGKCSAERSVAIAFSVGEVRWPYQGEDEHPEGYDGSCACNTCLTSG